MVNKKDIKILLSKMTSDYQFNLNIIKNVFGNLNYKDEEEQSILHILVDDKYDESKCFIAIKTLLQSGLNPNLKAYYNYNFIQTALYTGYSEDFILKIINEALKYNLNVNHVDDDKDTIMHTAIYSDDYLGEIEKIYDLLKDNGYDSSLRDRDNRNLIEAMISENKHSKEQIESFKRKVTISITKENCIKKDVVTKPIKTLSENDILELEKYGKILNKKNYMFSPTIGREKELKNLMIVLAQDKKRPLIVGESGVGKTSLVEEFVYQIKNNQVPLFLQNKIILEVNPSDIVAGCQYVGMFEEKMINLMNLCEKLEVILFIDEIHTIYGIGSSKGKDNDMSSILKYYIDRTNVKVIGTTTENEYNKFFSNDALKRRFEKITIKEPNDEVLYRIIDKVIGDYYIKYGISLENENIREEIINIILKATRNNCRLYNDNVNNPDLAISIVDKAFAFAKVYDCSFINEDHFIESFEYADRLYDTAKEEAIISLKNLDSDKNRNKRKILRIDFGNTKK